MVIKVYTKYPELKKVEEGEEKPETPEVTIKEHMLGFCIIDLTEFVFNNELKVLEKKYNLFEYEDEGLFKNSELHWPLPDERTILRKSAEEVTKLKEEKYQPVKVRKNGFFAKQIKIFKGFSNFLIFLLLFQFLVGGS